MIRNTAILAAAATIVLGTGSALAQNPSLPPNYGAIKLSAGFQPDPYQISVEPGGPSNPTAAGENCTFGYISDAPDFRIFYTAGSYGLYFLAESSVDTTMLVRGPDGAYLCSDDFRASNPAVSYDFPSSGQYDIWVGTYSQGVTGEAATLSVTEDSTFLTGGTLDWSLDPIYGTYDLLSGFTPDPFTAEVEGGGTVDVYAVIQDPDVYCSGYASSAPTIRVNYTAGGFPLYFTVNSETDTTLIVSDPDGNWACDDDSLGNYNPTVGYDSPLSGQYDIWVGTYDGNGATAAATFGVTEIPPPGSEGVDPTAFPLDGTYDLPSGFTPDPQMIPVTAGGPVDFWEEDLGPDLYCAGLASVEPNVRLNYTAGSFPLYLYVMSEFETGLVVLGPDGTWVCDDGYEWGDPRVAFEAPLSGEYNIWVTDLWGDTGGSIPATLYVSELPPPDPVIAANLDFSLPPAFGEATLASGFEPDPYTAAVTAGGDIDLWEEFPVGDVYCAGWATSGPTFRLQYSAGMYPLYIYVMSEADTTLAINGPDGEWTCIDDSMGSNPAIGYDAPASGQYDIWVGSYSESAVGSAATLYVSELMPEGYEPPYVDEPMEPVASALDGTLDPVHGTYDLPSGFTPDPFTVEVAVGGPTDGSSSGDSWYCYGYTTTAPSVSINYVAGAFPLYIYGTAEPDTTLIVAAPDGSLVCDDDSAGYPNPLVTFETPATGEYDIWYAAYSSDTQTTGTLSISEVSPAIVDNPIFDEPAAGMVDPTAAPLFGETTLTAGFSPDPMTFPVSAGGPLEAWLSIQDVCAGTVTAETTYRLTYAAGAWPLIVSVDTGEGGVDATLAIQGPDGMWTCDDDGGELRFNPSITYSPAVAGTYNIYVGSLATGDPMPATLYISEVQSQ